MPPPPFTRHIAVVLPFFTISAGLAAPSAESLKFFESKVRPVLVQSCQECHGEKKHKGGLRLDNLPYILHGGDQGPAIVPHKPEESLLIKAVNHDIADLEMPPDSRLPEDQVNALKQWIAMGAPWPGNEVSAARPPRRPGEFTSEDRAWWAFQPVREPALPKLRHEGNAIDAFIEDGRLKAGLKAVPQASPEELIRRLSFDLTGLPPAPDEVAQFVRECASGTDRAEHAYEALVNRLLASPRFGERMAQHWLDLVRYAESEGYRLDAYRPNVWPYRDYVIDSFNQDKPYDQFVREQLAGDELAPGDPKSEIATAFLRHTVYEYNQRDAEGQWRTIMNEVTDVTADVFLGMSVQCAQCHDHKFDPVLQKDYYRLQSFLANITWPEDKKLATKEEIAAHERQHQAWLEATREPRAVIDGILEPRIQAAQKSAMEKFPEEVVAMWRKPRGQRTPYEEQIVQLAWRQAEYERYRFKTDKIKEPEATHLREAQARLAAFDPLRPKPLLTAYAIGETGPVAGNASFKTRRSGEVAAKPGFLTILDPGDARIPEPRTGATTSGRRSVLAGWFASPGNPLTTRVIVNRLWSWHFGRGIAGTPSDFGRLGEPPTHPELLDWLTVQFLKGGWKMKPIHKMIVMSAAYRQSALLNDGTALQVDPENRLLWRFPPRRLDAEQARDAVLLASGELDLTMGGEGVAATVPRRSIYTRKIRNTQDAFLQSLDAPPGFSSLPTRDATTTATQSLLMINGEWPLERARSMAARLLKEKPANDGIAVSRAYQLTMGRDPSRSESRDALDFLTSQRASLKKSLPPPPSAMPAVTDAAAYFGVPSPTRTTKTLWMEPGGRNEKLRISSTNGLEGDAFAIEAVIHLKSLYPSGSVRTIASRWDNSKTARGWAFGVTSEKSAYKPNNLIVQLVGEDFQGSLAYEVVASGLRIPLGRPYYVAAILNNGPAEGRTNGGSITFHARDLGDPAAAMQTVTVPHSICGGHVSPECPLYIGGRDKDKASLWHGAISRVVLRQGGLEPGRLMAWVGMNDPACLVDVNADLAGEQLKSGWKWESSAPAVLPGGGVDPAREALADLCHVLLNASEFFYLH
ncbi:MAG: hypothetical protein CJBNEKGG_04107 [Prosthecobacter sp.]|nr:hypothetical protein [Prosthecobacter sp.]